VERLCLGTQLLLTRGPPSNALECRGVVEMKTPLKCDPIFVHASPRSGSTYFFNVLRRNHFFLLCFKEAINDGFRAGDDKDRITAFRKSDALRLNRQRANLNHGFLDRADFEEFIEAKDAVLHLFPKHQKFQNYLPRDGILQPRLATYLAALLRHASDQKKRPVLCEIYSRGRAGALRNTFGGFHIAQYRDPLSQFGSFVRLAIEQGWWFFLAFPIQEVSISGTHSLYQLIPERWRPPVLMWGPADSERWATNAQCNAMAASEPDGMENVFRWHMFSWVLTNLAAISYSDLSLDVDKIYDDETYRAAVIDKLASKIGGAPDLSDVARYDRYYEFQTFDVTTVCDQVVSSINSALHDGRLEQALRTLGNGSLIVPPAVGLELLVSKLRVSLTSMAASADRVWITSGEWRAVTKKHRRIWFDPRVRSLVKKAHPVAASAMHVMRRTGFTNVLSHLSSLTGDFAKTAKKRVRRP
jgi:hypothetical protein